MPSNATSVGPELMKAVVVRRPTGPTGIEVRDVPEPETGAGIRIEAFAAGLTFSDLLMSKGQYQTSADVPFVLGSDVSGVVAEAPAECPHRVGDRVMALASGAIAETVVAAPARTFRIPDGLNFTQAAGFVMNYHTAHTALHRRGRLRRGEVVLVHGASGGVGTATVQLAKAAGCRVIAVVSSPEKRVVADEAGADDVLASEEDWTAGVRDLTSGRGADVIMDPVGGDRFDQSIRCLAAEGRLLVVGFTSGHIPSLKVNRLLLRNIDVVGVYALLDQATAAALSRLVGEGLRPLDGMTYPMERTDEALTALADRRALRKLSIRIRDETVAQAI